MRIYMKHFALATLCLLLTACGGFEATLKKTAARDFSCEEDRIEVSQNEASRLWQVNGCEKKAEYRCWGCAFGAERCEKAVPAKATSVSR